MSVASRDATAVEQTAWQGSKDGAAAFGLRSQSLVLVLAQHSCMDFML
jgi:hypothetical protein